MMGEAEMLALERDVEASVVPTGTRVTLEKGESVTITQSLGGTFTVVVNGNMFRIDGQDADALGKESVKSSAEQVGRAETEEDLEKQVWDQMKTCYDPEIPVNIVDLGLIYDCHIENLESDSNKVNVRMTLTAPGCGMGPAIQADVENKILCVETVDEVDVELVWEPIWGREMMSEAARLELGMM
jgi:probable FeS assembly SUF system protein SufT